MSNKIITKNLQKIYHTFEKEEGLKGSIKALFEKKRTDKVAVEQFDLLIKEGEFVGLIGPNGAGKTTLIKMLTGIIRPTSGEASVFGYTPNQLKDDFKKIYALVMGQKSQLWWDLPAVDTFLLNKEIYGIPDKEYRENLGFFSELFNLKDFLKIQVRELSLGERMKMELTAALLHNPKILFLDEPTIGLDAVAQKQMRQFLKEINSAKAVTILLTSHYMEDIKHLCRRTVVINKGRKIYDGSLDTLLEKYQDYRTITISLETEAKIEIKDAEWIENSGYKAVFKIKKNRVKKILQEILSRYEIDDVKIEEEEIGSVVEKIYAIPAKGK